MSNQQPDQQPNKEQNITMFLEQLRMRLPNWDGQTWKEWAPHECADAVRAIAKDYVDNYGDGHDWQEAARHAELVLAATYNDIVNVMFTGQPASRMHDLHVRLSPSDQDEAFEILLSRPLEHLIPPLPAIGGIGFAPRSTLTSMSAQALGRAPAKFDATTIPDEPILQALDTISNYINGKDRVALMIVAAMVVRWRGCQVTQVIQGGATYRLIRNPLLPNQPSGDARVLYARVGLRMNQTLITQGPASNIVVMV